MSITNYNIARRKCLLTIAIGCWCLAVAAQTFKTDDTLLQRLYNTAENKCLANISNFGKYKVLVEGAGYTNVWLETQPMGGAMYAKRNPEIAKNNQLIFMDFQRADGRLPGMISMENGTITPHFGWLQGFCFPEEALDVYYWTGRDRAYLLKLYYCLAGFDKYLWRNRDSDGDGCLESWCTWDTGDDNSVIYAGAPNEWGYAYPPRQGPVPMASMDVMSYSYSCRATLAEISVLLHNGQSLNWQKKAKAVKRKIKAYLWDPVKAACYNRDPRHIVIPILLSSNIRCMYYSSFDQQMANAFISKHLLNPAEFWTKMPLPSIAVSDPAFKNLPDNNWSGQPEGLTFQRAIRALENYGHYAEVGLIGKRLIITLKREQKFTQQYDPFTGKASNSPDGYGPTMLSLLEYVSKMYGVAYERDNVLWSGLSSSSSTSYTQIIKGNRYTLKTDRGKMTAFINDQMILTCSAGARLITNLSGKRLSVIGIDSTKTNVLITYHSKNYRFALKPNEKHNLY